MDRGCLWIEFPTICGLLLFCPSCDWLAWRLALIQQSVIDSEAVEGEMYWGVERQTGRRLCWGCVSRMESFPFWFWRLPVATRHLVRFPNSLGHYTRGSGNLTTCHPTSDWLTNIDWAQLEQWEQEQTLFVRYSSSVMCAVSNDWLGYRVGVTTSCLPIQFQKDWTVEDEFIVRCNWMKTGICVKPTRCPNKASPPPLWELSSGWCVLCKWLGDCGEWGGDQDSRSPNMRSTCVTAWPRLSRVDQGWPGAAVVITIDHWLLTMKRGWASSCGNNGSQGISNTPP